MNNLEILKYCKENPEPSLDSFYFFIKKHKNLDKYVATTKIIKQKLFAIKEMSGRKNNNGILSKLISELSQMLSEYANFSEFGSFLNACEVDIEHTKDKDKKTDFKKIVNLYLENRDLTEITPSEWIQAMIDKGASRKKGKLGEEKLMSILSKDGYLKSTSIKDLMNHKLSFGQCSKNGPFSNKAIKEEFGLNFTKHNQNKSLDLIIKKGKDIFLLEAKHIHVSGGAQDKQIGELINLVGLKSPKDNIHIVSFLDGRYSNTLLGSDPSNEKKNKSDTQHKNIIHHLKINESNYWLNTTGFVKLFKYKLLK